MTWFQRHKQRPPEEVHVPIVNFIGEQDGPPEQELKQSLRALFQARDTVISAYLARVDYGNPQDFNIALCIRQVDPLDERVKIEAAQIFSKHFGSHEHLDIILIRDDQEDGMKRVCKAFYEQGIEK